MSTLRRRDFLAAAAAAPMLGALPAFGQDNGNGLIVHGTSPMNAEPQLANLVKSWMTPTDQFYIRSHAPNPKIDPATFQLKIEGMVERPMSISLSQLANDYGNVNVTATLTCAGNRRYEHSKISPVGGVPWREGAIGNAVWGGVPLSAILKKAGVKPEAKHVWFEGLDESKKGGGIIPFGASIPIQKAMDDTKGLPGALVVTQMNKQPLTPDHGFPVRNVVPGYIGARSVKWLGKIIVSDKPSTNHYVATAYKIVERADAIEWAEKAPIFRFVLNSAICTPAGGKVQPGTLSVSGYALPHGDAGRSIKMVEVSADDGKSWSKAQLSGDSGPYCWRLWKADVRVQASTTGLMVRATDSAGKNQPQTMDWNKKGYLFNSWHRVELG